MHASSLENMHKCYRRYISGSELEQQHRVVVVDVGGADVNGSYREIFKDARFDYFGVDLAQGEGVHIVLEDPNRLPIDDRSVDILVSGQMLEHCEFFWLAFSEMVRVLKPGGFIFLIAPSSGPEHRYPVDCYRFYPDAYRALARYANCDLLEVWQDERGPWNDLVGVFQRRGLPAAAAPRPLPETYDLATSPEGAPEEEVTQGDAPYLDVLAKLHEAASPALYLEIGIRHGQSLSRAQGAAIGVDPNPELTVELPPSTRIVTATSDEFFEDLAATTLPGAPDLAMIDGLHLFENALRDFMNVERRAAPGGLVIIDDIFPSHVAQAARTRRTRVWTGDVWKIIGVLRRWRPDLTLMLLDTAPTGLLLVGGLKPDNRTLWEHYNPIVRAALQEGDPPLSILRREGAVAPTSAIFVEFLDALAATRDDHVGRLAALRRAAGSH